MFGAAPRYRPGSSGFSVQRSTIELRLRYTAFMLSVTDKTFHSVLDAPLAVVDFWSPDCPSCMKYKPAFEAVSRDYKDAVLVVGAQVDQNEITADAYAIDGIPTTVLMRDGIEVFRKAGPLSRKELSDRIKEYLGV